MKTYVTARFKGAENKEEIEQLCQAVHAAGMQDYCFVRDVEQYRKTFSNPKDLWARTLQELKTCDALLINVSDVPTGGRVIEAGIAYALGMPVFVIVKEGVAVKEVFTGIATKVMYYATYDDLTPQLAACVTAS